MKGDSEILFKKKGLEVRMMWNFSHIRAASVTDELLALQIVDGTSAPCIMHF